VKGELANPHLIAESDRVRGGVEQFERDLPPEAGVDEARIVDEQAEPPDRATPVEDSYLVVGDGDVLLRMGQRELAGRERKLAGSFVGPG
jgi:hypothetical protein